MPKIALVCDSTADLQDVDLVNLGVDMVPLNVHFGTELFRDYVDITPSEFLTRLATTPVMPRTSQPSPAAFQAVYESVAADCDAILVLTLSSKLSGTYQSAVLGAKSANLSTPVRVLDSLSASIGLGLQVRRARSLIDSGLPIDEIVTTLEAERSQYHLIFFADTLEYLQRGGRIGKASQLVGSILKIKPLLIVVDGEVEPYERTRSRSRAIEGLIEYARQFSTFDQLAILHDGTTPEDVTTIEQGLADLIAGSNVIVSQYGPIIATHVGPKALGLCVFTGPPGH
ncbi:MAG TPA: DegV family protein [Thermomicrobiales bacterium]|nr:DegV family protein [Thermomicrobiales bacterium]